MKELKRKLAEALLEKIENENYCEYIRHSNDPDKERKHDSALTRYQQILVKIKKIHEAIAELRDIKE